MSQQHGGARYASGPVRVPSPPRRVAPPVPVPDPPRTDPQPPRHQLPPVPGARGKAPRLDTAPRVPADLPFVIQPRVSRWVLLCSVPFVLLLVPVVLLFVFRGWGTGLLTLAAILVAYTLASGFATYTHTLGGPLLAADREAVWLRARKWPVKAMRVPWELVAEVSVKHWVVDKAVCLVPRDDRVGRFDDVWSAYDQLRTAAYFRTHLTASVRYGDRSERETLQALADLAAGRARIAGAVPRYSTPGSAGATSG